MSAADVLLDKLHGVVQTGGGWSALCPAHADRSPSLSISARTEGDPGVVVHCHTGCDPEQVVTAVGLTMTDLFDKKKSTNGTKRREIVREYDYLDEHGTVLFQVVRFEPKDFRQRRPDGRGGWEWKLGGTRVVPYRLPQLIAADPTATVFVVEGEKDVETLVAGDHVATTGPMGAGNWSKVAAEAQTILEGRDVAVIADRDTPGRNHARDVARSLREVAADITICEPVIGKDISEHLGAGRRIDELTVIASSDPDVGAPMTVDQWLDAAGDQDDLEESMERTGKSPPARDAIVDIAEEHYDIGRIEDERTYIVPRDGPNIALLSGAAKSDLARRYRAETGKTIGRTPLDEAWMTIDGIAHHAAKTALPLRVGATASGTPVIDLGDIEGRAIVVTADGWTVVDRSPITFRRSKAMLPLDEPVRGGSVDEMFSLLNVTPGNRALFASWLISTLFEALPHPASVLRGEQGAAKSSTARAMTQLIDPCMAATQKPPRSDDEWAQVCTARWMVAVDNVSNVSEWWSDALCRTVTGDGWLRRALYTDDDVVATTWRRCVILNGITLGATLRPDLAERLVLFELTRPPTWLTESEVDERLDAMRPRVLGALLDVAVEILKVRDDIDVVRDLRMADFATFLAAHDQATGLNALASYREQLDSVFDEAIESDAVAMAVIEMMETREDWEGTARHLLDVLHEPVTLPPDWPTSARAMTNAMSRSSAMLRKIGIIWQVGRRVSAGKLCSLSKATS